MWPSGPEVPLRAACGLFSESLIALFLAYASQIFLAKTHTHTQKKPIETCDIIGIHYSKWMCCRGWFQWVSEQYRHRSEKSMSHLVLIKSFHSCHSHGLCIWVQECLCTATLPVPCGQHSACGMADVTPQLTLIQKTLSQMRKCFLCAFVFHFALCFWKPSYPKYPRMGRWAELFHLASVMPHSQYN